MAKFSMGYLGPFSGRLGNAVGYMWNGKCCMRAYRGDVKNPRTPAQQAHRAMFKQEVQLAARMRWAVNTTMTDLAREAGMTAYNLFVKVNQHAFGFADGELQVDYASLHLSMGDACGAVPGHMELDDDNVLSVSFERGTGRAFDQVYLYVYVPDLGSGFLSTPVYRRERQLAVALPDAYAGHAMHAWLMVRAEDGRWSESAYCGEPENRLVAPSLPTEGDGALCDNPDNPAATAVSHVAQGVAHADVGGDACRQDAGSGG